MKLLFTLVFAMVFINPFSNGVWAQSAGATYGIGNLDSQALRSFSANYRHSVLKFYQDDLVVVVGARYSNYSRNADLDLGESKSVYVSGVQVHSLNVQGGVEFDFTNSLGIGMNIDIVGFSVGPEQEVRFANGASSKAKPTGTNLLLGGKNDRGSLNSEYFGSFKFDSHLRLRSGFSHQVVEYEANVPTEKLQRFYDVFFVGLDWIF